MSETGLLEMTHNSLFPQHSSHPYTMTYLSEETHPFGHNRGQIVVRPY